MNLVCDITDLKLEIYRRPLPFFFKMILLGLLIFSFSFVFSKNGTLADQVVRNLILTGIIIGLICCINLIRGTERGGKYFLFELNSKEIRLAPVHHFQIHIYDLSEIESIIIAQMVKLKISFESTYIARQMLVYVKKPAISAHLFPTSGISVSQDKYYYMISLPNLDSELIVDSMKRITDSIPITLSDMVEL